MLNFMGMHGDSFATNDYICLDGHIYVWSLHSENKFPSALDFLYICALRTYTDALRQNQSKLCFSSQLLVYLS